MKRSQGTAAQSDSAARPNWKARDALERELRATVSDSLWSLLEEDGHVQDYQLGASSISDLAMRARRIREAGRRQSSPSTQDEPTDAGTVAGPHPTVDARARAVADLDAAWALREGKSVDGITIEEFRGRHLPSELLAPGEAVYRWLEERSAAEGPTSLWLRVRLPAGHQIKAAKLPTGEVGIVPIPEITLGAGGQAAEHIDRLTMTVPDEDLGTTEISVAEGDVLDELRRLSSRVARDVGWTEAETVAFILTGLPPVAPLIDTEPRNGNRITLSIHPSITSRELAAAYGFLRRRRGLSARRLTEKHMALAAFLHARPSGETWKQRMTAWNAEQGRTHKEWRYSVYTNFARDAVAARKGMEERDAKSRG